MRERDGRQRRFALRVTARSRAQALRRELGGMQRLPSGHLLDLLTAAEAIRHDQCCRICGTHARQQHTLADPNGNAVLVTFETERAGIPQHPEGITSWRTPSVSSMRRSPADLITA